MAASKMTAMTQLNQLTLNLSLCELDLFESDSWWRNSGVFTQSRMVECKMTELKMAAMTQLRQLTWVPPMDIRPGHLPHPPGHYTWGPTLPPSASEIWWWSITGDLFKLVRLGTYPPSGSTSGGGNSNIRFPSILQECCWSDKLEVFETRDFHHSYPILKWTRICQISQKQKWPPV